MFVASQLARNIIEKTGKRRDMLAKDKVLTQLQQGGWYTTSMLAHECGIARKTAARCQSASSTAAQATMPWRGATSEKATTPHQASLHRAHVGSRVEH